MKDKQSLDPTAGQPDTGTPKEAAQPVVEVEVRRSIRILAGLVAILGLIGLIALLGLAFLERNALGWVGAFFLAPIVGMFGKFALRGRFRLPLRSEVADPAMEGSKRQASPPPLPQQASWRLFIRITFLFAAMLGALAIIFAKFPGVLVRSVTGAGIGIVLVLAIVWVCAFISGRKGQLPPQ